MFYLYRLKNTAFKFCVCNSPFNKKAYDNGLNTVRVKLEEAEPIAVSLQMDGWTAHHHGYMGAIIGNYYI